MRRKEILRVPHDKKSKKKGKTRGGRYIRWGMAQGTRENVIM